MLIKNVQLTISLPGRWSFIEDALAEVAKDPFIRRLTNQGRQLTSYIVISQEQQGTELLLNFE